MSNPIMYSTESRSRSGPVPSNTQESVVHLSGHFRIRELFQTDVLDVVRQEPPAPPALATGYEVSLSETIKNGYGSVGMICLDGEQLGSCTLISSNLGFIPCHCIQELDVRKLLGKFGFCTDNVNQMTHAGTLYQVEGIVEFNQELDYAIIKFKETPGEKYGFIHLDPEEEAHDEPALLHHPIGKPLKVSVRPIIHSMYHSRMLATFHDSDYGSSGGAYISPRGNCVAFHLGSERQPKDYNLVRHALPTRTIIADRPTGIIAAIAYGKLNQKDRNEHLNIINISIPFFPRGFIDLEKYDKLKMKDYGYVVRSPVGFVPGIIIDSHQKKHLPGWPSQIQGKHGSIFPFAITNDDLVAIVEAIGNNIQLFSTHPIPFANTKVERWYFDKNHLDKALLRKLTNPAPTKKGIDVPSVIGIQIEYGWLADISSWEMHVVPLTK